MIDPGILRVIYDYAPWLGFTVAAAVVGLGVLGRMVGFTAIGDKSKLVDNSKIDGVAQKLEAIEKRITTVEHDIKDRPTREEMHQLDLGMARIDGRMAVFEAEIKAVRATVNRIDDFMLAISERSIRGRGGD